jgi:hypothetical protein
MGDCHGTLDGSQMITVILSLNSFCSGSNITDSTDYFPKNVCHKQVKGCKCIVRSPSCTDTRSLQLQQSHLHSETWQVSMTTIRISTAVSAGNHDDTSPHPHIHRRIHDDENQSSSAASFFFLEAPALKFCHVCDVLRSPLVTQLKSNTCSRGRAESTWNL